MSVVEEVTVYDRRRFTLRASLLEDADGSRAWALWLSHRHGDHHAVTDPDRVEEMGRKLLDVADRMRSAQSSMNLRDGGTP